MRTLYHRYSGMKSLMSEFHQRFVRPWEGHSHRSQSKLGLCGNVRLRPAFPNSGSVSTSMKKRLAFWWIVANTLAWTIGIVFVLPGLWAWIVCGAIVGTAQWLVLHRSLRLSPAWIAATCLAWTAGIWAGRLHADGLF